MFSSREFERSLKFTLNCSEIVTGILKGVYGDPSFLEAEDSPSASSKSTPLGVTSIAIIRSRCGNLTKFSKTPFRWEFKKLTAIVANSRIETGTF
jgi:hypothetical protein